MAWRMFRIVSVALLGLLAFPAMQHAPVSAQQARLATLDANAKALYDDGRYAEAAIAQKQALDATISQYGLDRAETAASLYQMGRCLSALGQYDPAGQIHRQALAIRERLLGRNHPEVGESLNRIGALHVIKGQFAEAETTLKRSLSILETAYKDKNIEVANTLDNLAWLNETLGRYSEAETFFARAVAITEKILGADHPETATRLSNFSAVKKSLGQWAPAYQLLTRSLAIREKALRADHPDIAESLHNVALIEAAIGQYKQAEPRYLRALQIWRKAVGEDHPVFGAALTNLAALYVAQGRFPDAEKTYRQALAIREKALGPEHRETGATLNNLAILYMNQGRYANAEPMLKRSLAITEKALGPEHLDAGQTLNNLGNLYLALGRYKEAQPYYERSLRIKEKSLGADAPQIATTVQNLGNVFNQTGKSAQAEALYNRALAITEKAVGRDHPDVASILQNLAALQETRGRYAEAESAARRSLAIREKALGLEHPDVADNLNNLAKIFISQSRFDEAIPLNERAVDIWTKTLGADHPNVGRGLNNLAGILQFQRRYDEAEPLYQRALAIRRKALGTSHPDVAETLNNLAGLYSVRGKLQDAQALFRQALEIRIKAFGEEHPDTLATVGNLADNLVNAGLFVEAESLQKRALGTRLKTLGADHPFVALTRNSLALIYWRLGRLPAAIAESRQSTQALIAHSRLEGGRLSSAGLATVGVVGRRELDFRIFLALAHQLSDQNGSSRDALAAESFVAAQWARSSLTASAVAQMSLRASAASPELSTIVRQRQDLAGEWKTLDGLLTAALTKPADARRLDDETVWRSRLAAIQQDVARIDAKLETGFPDYAALASTAPVSARDAQALLAQDEALIQYFTTSEQSYVWVVTKDGAVFKKLSLNEQALGEQVHALRCGLDLTAWSKGGEARCQALLKTAFTEAEAAAGKALPFDLNRAHDLYRILFADIQPLIEKKHLLIVPSGALSTLPFGVLVTERPTGDGYGAASWLGERQALTTLPAAASLKALRKASPLGAARKPFIGFGNPLLSGPDGANREAWDAQQCAKPGGNGAAPRLVSARTPSLDVRGLARVGPQNLEMLRRQYPLPETSRELCAVASLLNAEANDVLLGGKATEAAVKQLDASGALRDYATLHFATHGLVAGDISWLAEPALLMTPPEAATAEDDGLLKASEVALLTLNADWIVLSACNTAAAGAQNAEALSGLARAFFYAGARSVLASHWPVNSNAAVKLTTRAFAIRSASPAMRRAEALRRAMSSLIKSKDAGETHPSYWAPFVIAGASDSAQ